jgi:hypothetical protein
VQLSRRSQGLRAAALEDFTPPSPEEDEATPLTIPRGPLGPAQPNFTTASPDLHVSDAPQDTAKEETFALRQVTSFGGPTQS